jgi:hypothetical protein
MSSDSGGGIIIIRRKLSEPAFYDQTTPADGVGKYLAMVKVWHLVVLAFIAGALIF